MPYRPCQGRQFAHIHDAAIITGDLGIVEVLQAAGKMNFRFSRGQG